MSGYPFRFYGGFPTDWAEGANAGHEFTVNFVRAPTEDEQRELGRSYAAALRQGRAQPASHGFSGRHLQLIVGERGRAQSHGEHIGPITRFLYAAHRIVPIVDAVYENAREGIDAWSQWSLEQAPPESRPGPATPRFALFRRPSDPSLALFAPSVAFDEGQALAHDAQRRRKLEAEVGRESDKPVHLARVAKADSSPEPEKTKPADLASFDLAAITPCSIPASTSTTSPSSAAARVWPCRPTIACSCSIPPSRRRGSSVRPSSSTGPCAPSRTVAGSWPASARVTRSTRSPTTSCAG